MFKFITLGSITLAALLMVACGDRDGVKANDDAGESPTQQSESQPPKTSKTDPAKAPKRGPAEADRVTVRLMILPCQDSRLGLKSPKPSQLEALGLAASLKLRVDASKDKISEFETLAAKHSADADYATSQGMRTITNWGVRPNTDNGERARAATPAIADQAFKLAVGAVAVVDLDPKKNPLGVVLLQRIQ